MVTATVVADYFKFATEWFLVLRRCALVYSKSVSRPACNCRLKRCFLGPFVTSGFIMVIKEMNIEKVVL